MTDNPYAAPEHLDVPPKPRKERQFSWIRVFTVVGIIVLLMALLVPASRSSRPAAERAQCVNNLKQIALALYNYESTYHALPPACTVDSNGKALHSWRTLILPYLDQQKLYESIDLKKPWNDPANANAYKTEVPGFRCPSNHGPEIHTTYLASVAPNGCFRLTEPRPLSEITDNHGETIMVIEVATDKAVHWMSPMNADAALVIGLRREDAKLAHPGGSNAAFVDGSVHFLKANMPAADLRAIISIAGNEKAIDFP